MSCYTHKMAILSWLWRHFTLTYLELNVIAALCSIPCFVAASNQRVVTAAAEARAQKPLRS